VNAAPRAGGLVVVSPHLDDAVFGCGGTMACAKPATVVTVFAGVPPGEHAPTPWDSACGFSNGTDAVLSRRAEDAAALQELGARPHWLEFLDRQYRESPTVAVIAGALADILLGMGPAAVMIPLGLYHSDHELTHEACLLCRRQLGGTSWMAYEEAMYRRRNGAVQRRLARLLAQGITATPLSEENLRTRLGGDETSVEAADREAGKRRALLCYASQLRAFSAVALADTAQPERLWDLSDG
jgi:LmbE family N-acetylglucosaminyl deacetylase